MCGISGFCDFKNDFTMNAPYWTQILENMHQTLSHRGNDNLGTYLSKQIGLSHARLSIRDIAGGNQPMIRNVKNRMYAIVYNGEIYNTDELKSNLISDSNSNCCLAKGYALYPSAINFIALLVMDLHLSNAILIAKIQGPTARVSET